MNPMYEHADKFRLAITGLGWTWLKMREEPYALIYYIRNTGTLLTFYAGGADIISFNDEIRFSDYFIEECPPDRLGEELKYMFRNSISDRFFTKVK